MEQSFKRFISAHKNLPSVLVPSQINWVHMPPFPHLKLVIPSRPSHSCFPTKILYAFLLAPIHATCSTHLILLHLTTQTISGKKYKSWSSSLCNLLQSPVTSSLLGPNNFLAHCSPTTSTYAPSSMWETKFHTHINQEERLQFRTFYSLYFRRANQKTVDFRPYDSRHSQVQSPLYLFMNVILVYYSCSQIYEFCHTLEVQLNFVIATSVTATVSGPLLMIIFFLPKF